MLRALSVLLIMGLLSACSGESDEKPITETRPPSALYAEAENSLAERRYKTAAEQFQEIERLYPASDEATHAQVMAAFTNYRDGKYDDAEIILDRFIKLHPAHKDIAYAYYMKAIGYYEQITDIARDQRMTEDALNALREVVQRFPDTPYARDARIKIDLTQDHLAGKQLEIGRFYQQRGETAAGINRFREVVERYQTTSQVPEALHRLVESYLLLGVVPEAQKYAAVLGHNFPDSPWYRRSYALLGKDAPDLAKKPKDDGLFDLF